MFLILARIFYSFAKIVKSVFRTLYRIAASYSSVSNFVVDALQYCRKLLRCFKFGVRCSTGSGKTAFLFQNPRSITTESVKTAFLFQNPRSIETGSVKTAFLFQ